MDLTDLPIEIPIKHDAPDQAELVAEQVAMQAASRPEATAVESVLGILNYRQLDNYANQLSNRLRLLGVAPDVAVALCMQRSPALVVCALAVLKAGGAYLPLDPLDPPHRLELLRPWIRLRSRHTY